MKTKHTPGPWIFVEGERYVREESTGGGICLVYSDDGHASARKRQNYPREANARLISAAPELLAALEAMVKEFGPGDSRLDPDIISHRVVIAALAALSKARSE